MPDPRVTAGQVLPGGLVIPGFGSMFFGADDTWDFTTAPKTGVHAGIETSTMLNRKMAIRRRHFPFGNGPNPNFGWPTAEMIGWAGATNPSIIPMIAHGSQGVGASGFPVKTSGNGYTNTSTGAGGKTGIDRFVAGEWDAAYTNAFTRIKNAGGPWLFNLWMEMDIQAMGAYGGFQGGVSGAGQAAYIAAYRYIRGLADSAGANNIIWVWCPTAADPDNNKLTYYPGDASVHWIMEDVYRQEFAANVDDIYNFSVAHNKPFGVAESGFYDAPQGNQPKTVDLMVADWVAAMNSSKYANTVCWVPWNFAPTKNFTGNLIDSTAKGLAAYQAAANNAPFAGVFFTPGGPPPPPPGAVPATAFATTSQQAAGTITGSEVTGQDFENEFAVRCFHLDETAGVKYVGGFFSTVGNNGQASQYVLDPPTSTRNHIYAEDFTTGNLLDWNPNADGNVECISPVNPAGFKFLGGSFANIGGAARSKVAKLKDAASLATADASFNAGTIDGRVTGIDYDPSFGANGALYISGQFTHVNGTARAGLACLDGGTGALQAWNPGVTGSNHDCRRIKLNHYTSLDTDIYAVGEWDHINGTARQGVAALAKAPATASPAIRAWAPDLKGAISSAGTLPHDVDFKRDDGSMIVIATAGVDSLSTDGNRLVAYQLIQLGALNRVNTRLWSNTAQGDGGDHNAVTCDDTYAAGGHHGDGVLGTTTANNGGAGNRKCRIVNLNDGTPAGWIPDVQMNSIQGVYAVALGSTKFCVGGAPSEPRQGSLEYARTTTSGSPPVNTAAPTISDTTPAVGEAISVIGGAWQGQPQPTVVDRVQIAASLTAAGLQPVYAMSGNFVNNQLNDDSGNGNMGNLVTGVGGAAPSQVAGPPSIGGHAVNFDGSGSRVEVPDDSSLALTHWTLGSWVKLANPPGDTDPIHQRYEIMEKSGAYWLNIRYDTTPPYVVRGGAFFGPTAAFDNLDSVTPLVPGSWAHVAATYDGATLAIYINAVLDSSKPRTGDTTTSNEKLVIGAKHRVILTPEVLQAFMNGALTFHAFDHALTQPQIATLASLTFPVWADVATPYTPVSGDLGKVLRARETASNASGNAAAVGAPSSAIASSSTSPVNVTPPSLSDTTPQIEQLITVIQGVWTGSPTSIVDTIQIADATSGPWVDAAPAGQAYTTLDSDLGRFLRVREVATNPAGSTVLSTASSAIAGTTGQPPSNTIAPTLSPATVKSGVLITAAQGTWVGATGSPTYEFQERDTLGGAITTVQAASSTVTYTPGGTDFEIRVKVVRTNTNGSTAAFSDWAAPPVPYTINFQYPHPSAGGPSVIPSVTVPVSVNISPNPPTGLRARSDGESWVDLDDNGLTGGAGGEHNYTGLVTVDLAEPSPHPLDVQPH